MKKRIWLLLCGIIGCLGFFGYQYIPEWFAEQNKPSYSLQQIPAYTGDPSIIINGDQPDLETLKEKSPGLYLKPLDAMGRTGMAEAVITKELLPEGERGEIGTIKPSGWHTVKYPEQIEDRYLYNRSHLIAWCLLGDCTNVPENLITGTRYMNVEGMLPIEKEILGYVRKSGETVYYRVTPMYSEDNLLANGVLQEAISESGRFSLCRYCFNVQPMIRISYENGESWIENQK